MIDCEIFITEEKMTAYTLNNGIKSRPVKDESDYWKARELLIETWPIVGPNWNWDVRRWDGSYHHNEFSGWDARWGEGGKFVRIWETDGGKIVGVANPEGKGDAYLQIHPDFRNEIEEDMIEWAERNLARPKEGETAPRLVVFVWDYDEPRQAILSDRGYEKTDVWEVNRHLRFGNRKYPRPDIEEGYSLHTLDPDAPDEFQKFADLLNAAFGRAFHTAREVENFVRNSPSYRRDLDLLAVAPDGTFAANVGMIYEERYRYGLYEPVCTHPDHRRKGLAGFLMYEGLHRVRELGATDLYVGTGPMEAANAFYRTLGFTEVYKGYFWKKYV